MYNRIVGASNVAPLVCLNPRQDKWRIRLAIEENEDGSASWIECDFDHCPTADEVRQQYTAIINEEVSSAILEGFEYEGNKVWLSTENQMNYQAALLMVQQDENRLPIRVKLGTDEKPVFVEFDTKYKLAYFVTAISAHIQHCLESGWSKKEAFDVKPYIRE